MKKTWIDHAMRTVSGLLAAAVAAAACLSGPAFPAYAAGYGKDGQVRDMTSQQIVEDMGLGYNLGNTFDSIGSFISTDDPWEYQKGWGNDPLTRGFIRKVKEGGFKTIRFPVSWAQWINDNNQIDPGYMDAIETVVDWCMEEDFYVILNIHHDSGAADTSWVRKAATDWDWTSKRYEAVWTQIADNFKSYGDHLIFEGMNEVEFPEASNLSKQYEILNKMNQLFVDTVRKSGGNNAKRHLLIPGYNTNIERTCDRRYHFPEDPANHCILSIHYYSPSPFCVAEHDVDWAVPETVWGSEEDIKTVESDLDMLAETYLSKGTPVIIGEYGVLTEDQKEKDSIRFYLKKVPEIIMEYGMCPILWDTSNAGDMKFIERKSGEFYDPVIKNNYLELSRRKEAGEIKRRDFDFPRYKKVSVPVSTDGWVSLEFFQRSSIVGFTFDVGCRTGWDSYGGGGIYLDGWENTPNFQFQSVYDEVKHIFTEEEKERLQDRLGVMFWWTDETGGGNRAESLYVKQFTLLYDETGSNGSLDKPSYAVGGGDLGGVGLSQRPNNSTEPAGKLEKDTVSYVGRNAEPDEEGWFEIPNTDPRPIGICYKTSGGNKYGSNIQTDEGYGGWAGGSNNIQNIFIFESGYTFNRFKLEGKIVKNMTFLYGDGDVEDLPEPEEPELGENEVRVEPEERQETNSEGKTEYYLVYKIPDNKRVLKIRFKGTSTNYSGGFNLSTDGKYIAWVNFADGNEYDFQANNQDVTASADRYIKVFIGDETGENPKPTVEMEDMILCCEEVQEEVNKPELGENEVRPEPEEREETNSEGEKEYYLVYKIPDNKKVLKIRFKGMSTNYSGGFNLSTDSQYINWISFADGNEYDFQANSQEVTAAADGYIKVFIGNNKAEPTVKMEDMILCYEEVQEDTEDDPKEENPTVGDSEELIVPEVVQEGDKYYAVYRIPNGKQLLYLRCKGTSKSANEYYAGGFGINTGSEGYIDWVNFNGTEETRYEFSNKPGNTDNCVKIDIGENDQDPDITMKYMIFGYGEWPEAEDQTVSIEVTDSSPTTYDMTNLLNEAGLTTGQGVKICVTFTDDQYKNPEASVKFQNGVAISLKESGEIRGVLGSSRDLQFEGGVNWGGYKVTGIKVEKAKADPEIIAAMAAGGTIIKIPSALIEETSGSEKGLKIYYDYDWQYNMKIKVNGSEVSSDNLEEKEDDQGKYIWCSGVEKGDIEYSRDGGGAGRIIKAVYTSGT